MERFIPRPVTNKCGAAAATEENLVRGRTDQRIIAAVAVDCLVPRPGSDDVVAHRPLHHGGAVREGGRHVGALRRQGAAEGAVAAAGIEPEGVDGAVELGKQGQSRAAVGGKIRLDRRLRPAEIPIEIAAGGVEGQLHPLEQRRQHRLRHQPGIDLVMVLLIGHVEHRRRGAAAGVGTAGDGIGVALADELLHGVELPGIDVRAAAGRVDTGGAGPLVDDLVDQGVALGVGGPRDELLDQAFQRAAAVQRHGLLQAGHRAVAAQIRQCRDVGGDRHRGVGCAEDRVRPEPDIVHRGSRTVGPGKAADEFVGITLGIDVIRCAGGQTDRSNARLIESQQLARAGGAVRIDPNPQAGPHGVIGIDLAVAIRIILGERLKPVCRQLAAGQGCGGAEQLAAIGDIAAGRIKDQNAFPRCRPARGNPKSGIGQIEHGTIRNRSRCHAAPGEIQDQRRVVFRRR